MAVEGSPAVVVVVVVLLEDDESGGAALVDVDPAVVVGPASGTAFAAGPTAAGAGAGVTVPALKAWAGICSPVSARTICDSVVR